MDKASQYLDVLKLTEIVLHVAKTPIRYRSCFLLHTLFIILVNVIIPYMCLILLKGGGA